jgi:uncharacterized protein YbaR (Trm112 family)
MFASLMGGVITGLCRKAGTAPRQSRPVRNALICPTCHEQGHEHDLTWGDDALTCSSCGDRFPVVDDIVFLFSDRKLRELYPDKR